MKLLVNQPSRYSNRFATNNKSKMQLMYIVYKLIYNNNNNNNVEKYVIAVSQILARIRIRPR